MIRDITLGQYYPSGSVVHRLDARTKIIGSLIYIIEIFVVDDFRGLLLTTAALAALIAVSRVPPKFIFRGLKAVIIIILFTVVLNMFMTDGRVLWSWHFITITYEGLYRAVFLAARLILLIIGTSMLTLCTKPTELTDGLEKLLSPFTRIGVPAHEIALMMTISLRFIPTLLEETDRIMKAQQARGADFESGNIFQRGKSMVPILVPLFVSSFRIARDLALAMESRCYHGGSRTRMNETRFRRGDACAAVVIAAFFAVIVAMRVM
jgi:energy-coupling factor transport system permease protein